jgi:serine/threonine-protein phosphatase 2B catalytic subunit
MEGNQQNIDQSKYLDNAIRAVKEKKPLPEIDFSLHTMEDGTQVSTLERVCKGVYSPPLTLL